jgi:zinc finger (C-x8-C-x5-C-x3-H type) protein
MSGAQSRTDWLRKGLQGFRGCHPTLHHNCERTERDWKQCASPPLTGPDLNTTVPSRARHTINQVTVQSAHHLAEKMVRGFVCYSNGSLTQIKVVCQFFLRGACKFGNQCRNEHPQNGDRRSTFGGKSSVVLHCLRLSVNL